MSLLRWGLPLRAFPGKLKKVPRLSQSYSNHAALFFPTEWSPVPNETSHPKNHCFFLVIVDQKSRYCCVSLVELTHFLKLDPRIRNTKGAQRVGKGSQTQQFVHGAHWSMLRLVMFVQQLLCFRKFKICCLFSIPVSDNSHCCLWWTIMAIQAKQAEGKSNLALVASSNVHPGSEQNARGVC